MTNAPLKCFIFLTKQILFTATNTVTTKLYQIPVLKKIFGDF